MISPTPFYENLCAALDSAFELVRGVDPIECTTEFDHLRLQGFILISHSILEQYLEEVSYAAAKRAKQRLLEDAFISRALVALIANKVVGSISEQGKKKVTAELSSNLELFATEALTTFYNSVKSNNGITTKDQRNLLLPIGIDLEAKDIGLSQNLHSFGSKRGDVAHRFKLQREETLSGVLSQLEVIRRDLLSLDGEICAVC